MGQPACRPGGAGRCGVRRGKAGTAEHFLRCLRVLDHSGRVPSWAEELEYAQRTGVPQTARGRNIYKPEILHKIGEQHRSTSCPDLDDAFFERLEKAGQIAFCPVKRGVIEGYIHCYWRVRQNPKQDQNGAKEWRRNWTSIAKQAGSLAASLKATGIFEDKFWTILSIRAKCWHEPGGRHSSARSNCLLQSASSSPQREPRRATACQCYCSDRTERRLCACGLPCVRDLRRHFPKRNTETCGYCLCGLLQHSASSASGREKR